MDTGTGQYGTGTGEKFPPRDVPVPVWAGDGFVTGVVLVTRQRSWRVTTTSDSTERVKTTEGGGYCAHPLTGNLFLYIYLY